MTEVLDSLVLVVVVVVVLVLLLREELWEEGQELSWG